MRTAEGFRLQTCLHTRSKQMKTHKICIDFKVPHLHTKWSNGSIKEKTTRSSWEICRRLHHILETKSVQFHLQMKHGNTICQQHPMTHPLLSAHQGFVGCDDHILQWLGFVMLCDKRQVSWGWVHCFDRNYSGVWDSEIQALLRVKWMTCYMTTWRVFLHWT